MGILSIPDSGNSAERYHRAHRNRTGEADNLADGSDQVTRREVLLGSSAVLGLSAISGGILYNQNAISRNIESAMRPNSESGTFPAEYLDPNMTEPLVIAKPKFFPLTESPLVTARNVELTINPQRFTTISGGPPNLKHDSGGFEVIADNIANRVAVKMLLEISAAQGREVPLHELPSAINENTARWLPRYLAFVQEEMRKADFRVSQAGNERGSTMHDAMMKRYGPEDMSVGGPVVTPDMTMKVVVHCAARHDIALQPTPDDMSGLVAFSPRNNCMINVSETLPKIRGTGDYQVVLGMRPLGNRKPAEPFTPEELRLQHIEAVVREMQVQWFNNYAALYEGLRNELPAMLQAFDFSGMRHLALAIFLSGKQQAQYFLSSTINKDRNLGPKMTELIAYCDNQIASLEASDPSLRAPSVGESLASMER